MSEQISEAKTRIVKTYYLNLIYFCRKYTIFTKFYEFMLQKVLIVPWQCSFKKLCFFAPIMPKLLLAQSAKACPQVSRHNLLSYGTTYFLTAQFTLSRHNLLSSRHNLLSHGTTYFLTAKVTFLLQKLLFYCSRHNLLSHGGSQFSRRKCRESGQKNPIPTRPGSPPK